MTYKIETLEWDSDFFEIHIGLLNKDCYSFSAETLVEYDLLIDKSLKDQTLLLSGFSNTFGECKITFSKTITNTSFAYSDSILDSDFYPIKPEQLFELAFESGKYSRFKLDKRFSTEKFQSLYKKWVVNSLNKTFASKVFYTMKNNQIIGFVTLKKNPDYAEIGLIAVSEDHQGQGVGKQLLHCAEAYCSSQNLKELRIPTQKNNMQACNFYFKNNYTIHEELFIKHYWRNTL